MGKTFEALEQAEKEYQETILRLSGPLRTNVTVLPRRVSNADASETYEVLKTNLLMRYATASIKTLLFTGTAPGDGASTTAVNFTNALTKDPELKVLLVDTNLRTPSLHEVFNIEHTLGLSELVADGGSPESHIKRIGQGNFYVLPCGRRHSTPLALFESDRFARFMKTARESFDYVILDAPPVASFSEARIICAQVDGVVLVVGSGRTRRQVVLRAKKELEDAGGKVLGLVLNRRKFHIPEWIYKRL